MDTSRRGAQLPRVFAWDLVDRDDSAEATPLLFGNSSLAQELNVLFYDSVDTHGNSVRDPVYWTSTPSSQTISDGDRDMVVSFTFNLADAYISTSIADIAPTSASAWMAEVAFYGPVTVGTASSIILQSTRCRPAAVSCRYSDSHPSNQNITLCTFECRIITLSMLLALRNSSAVAGTSGTAYPILGYEISSSPILTGDYNGSVLVYNLSEIGVSAYIVNCSDALCVAFSSHRPTVNTSLWPYPIPTFSPVFRPVPTAFRLAEMTVPQRARLDFTVLSSDLVVHTACVNTTCMAYYVATGSDQVMADQIGLVGDVVVSSSTASTIEITLTGGNHTTTSCCQAAVAAGLPLSSAALRGSHCIVVCAAQYLSLLQPSTYTRLRTISATWPKPTAAMTITASFATQPPASVEATLRTALHLLDTAVYEISCSAQSCVLTTAPLAAEKTQRFQSILPTANFTFADVSLPFLISRQVQQFPGKIIDLSNAIGCICV